MNIKNVVVIGSGIMGSGIAAQLCNANVPVTLLDLKTEISKKAKLGKRTTKKSVEMMMKKFYEMASSLSYFNEIVYEKYNEKYPDSLALL